MKRFAKFLVSLLMRNKIYWMAPLIGSLIIVVILLFLSGSAPIHAPFLYSIF